MPDFAVCGAGPFYFEGGNYGELQRLEESSDVECCFVA